MLWSGFGNIFLQVLQFLFSIVLARILTPEDYGLTAILMIFYSLSMLFIDSGFSNALVRKEQLTQKDKSTAFFYNVFLGLICYIVLYVFAPFIADFYGKPILSSLLRVYGLTVVIVPFMLIQNMQLGRDINFKKIAEVNIISTLLSNILAIILACLGFGVWSLIYMYLSSVAIGVILYWKFSSWRPSLVFSKASFRYIFNFSSKMLLDGAIQTVINNLNNILIGKVFSPSILGFYSKASTLASLPSNAVNQVVLTVSFPVLSKIQRERERLFANYRKIIRLSAYMMFPLLIGLAAVAHPLVILVYTEKWASCVPYLQILCFSFLFSPILSLNKNILEVLNRPDLVLKIRMINTILFVLIVVVALQFGMLGLCWGMVCISLVNFIINTCFVSHISEISFTSQIKDILPILLNSLVMGFLVFLVSNINIALILQVILSIVVGITYYVLSSYCLRLPEMYEVIGLIKEKIKSKSS